MVVGKRRTLTIDFVHSGCFYLLRPGDFSAFDLETCPENFLSLTKPRLELHPELVEGLVERGLPNG